MTGWKPIPPFSNPDNRQGRFGRGLSCARSSCPAVKLNAACFDAVVERKLESVFADINGDNPTIRENRCGRNLPTLRAFLSDPIETTIVSNNAILLRRSASSDCGKTFGISCPHAICVLLMGLLVMASSGCRAINHCLSQQRGAKDPCPSCPPLCTAKQSIAYGLAEIPFDARLPIIQPVSGQSLLGWPISSEISVDDRPLRNLSQQQCEQMARSIAPIANEIETHRQWLAANNAACPGLLDALAYQADYERSLQAGQSMEVFLNLANIFSQQPNIAQSHSILDGTQRVLEKIRDAEVSQTGDTTALARQHLEIEEKEIELRQKQQQLTHGLELLLGLEATSTPIWTEISEQILPPRSLDLQNQYARAIAQRSDLKVLESLSNDCSQFTADQFEAMVASSSPLLGTGLPRPIAAAWWRSSRFKEQVQQEIDRVTAAETQRRREQLQGLADAKRKLIKRQLNDAITSIETAWKLLDVKQQRLTSLETAIRVAEKSKDTTTLDPAEHLKRRLELTKIESEIVDQQFQIAIGHVKLKQIRGDYAGHAGGVRECRNCLLGARDGISRVTC